MSFQPIAAALGAAVALCACSVAPLPARPPVPGELAPAQWQTPLPPTQAASAVPDAVSAPSPHAGQLTQLRQWWAQWRDADLLAVMDAAQGASPSVAAARSRIAQAQSERTQVQALLQPLADGGASTSRGLTQWGVPLMSSAQMAVRASWELDLFGQQGRALHAAEAGEAAARALWHDARVSVAADVAQLWVSWQACRKLGAVADAEAASRARSARTAQAGAAAGLASDAEAALVRAQAADARSRALQQGASCEQLVKALAALSGLPEGELRQRLPPVVMNPDEDALFAVASPVHAVPAVALAQRPDVRAAALAVEGARAQLERAAAARYPRLELSGSVGATRVRTAGVSSDLGTWSIGPLALSVPVLDGGRIRAAEAALRAAYDAQVAAYTASVRQAVRELEDALLQLHTSAARGAQALLVKRELHQALRAAEARVRAGLASQSELEDARRQALAAQAAWLSLQHERAQAWVALYRAAGGAWDAAPPL